MNQPSESIMRVALVGASGRMGGAVLAAIDDDPGVEVVAAVAADRQGEALRAVHGGAGQDPSIVSDLGEIKVAVDAVIDFSRPDALAQAALWCRDNGAALVSGTTGLAAQHHAALDDAATRVAVCLAANFSVGVNVMLALLEQAAAALGDDFDAEIVEAHHRHKVDAPSGTALRMGEAIAGARGTTLDEAAVYAREGQTGERPPGAIGFATVRGGDIVGDHRAMFAGAGEVVEIAHRATNRGNFAAGALRAARWAVQQTPGRYEMIDVLGLRNRRDL